MALLIRRRNPTIAGQPYNTLLIKRNQTFWLYFSPQWAYWSIMPWGDERVNICCELFAKCIAINKAKVLVPWQTTMSFMNGKPFHYSESLKWGEKITCHSRVKFGVSILSGVNQSILSSEVCRDLVYFPFSWLCLCFNSKLPPHINCKGKHLKMRSEIYVSPRLTLTPQILQTKVMRVNIRKRIW